MTGDGLGICIQEVYKLFVAIHIFKRHKKMSFTVKSSDPLLFMKLMDRQEGLDISVMC